MGGYIGRGQPVAVDDGSVETSDIEDNAVTDAKLNSTKLDGIESNATADQTGAQIKTAYEAESGAYNSTKDSKLSGIASSANNYSHPTSAGSKHIPTGGSSGQFLKYDSSGTAVWAADNNDNTTYSVGDGGLTQKNFTTTLKSKLDAIESNATADQTKSDIEALGIELPAANLTGTVADARISTLTSSKLTGALPAISGANLTNLPASGSTTLSGLTDATVSASDPAIDSNPSATGHLWINKTSGESYVATDATTDNNVWKNTGEGSGGIAPAPSFAASHASTKALWKNDFGTKSSAHTWTLSFWIKDSPSTNPIVFATNDGCNWQNGYVYQQAFSINHYSWYNDVNNTGSGLQSNSSWSHFMWVCDGGATSLYYNGTIDSGASTTGFNNYANFLPSQTTVLGGYYENGSCTSSLGGTMSIDFGYIVFLDGIAESVGAFRNTSTGEAKLYTGSSFGNNGFILDFADSSDMGKDVSGEGNHWSIGNGASSPTRISW